MRQASWIRCSALLGVVALLAPATTAVAQQVVTLADILGGKSVPLSMKPADLPADFKAVRIKVTGAGGGGIMDMFSAIMSPFAAMMGGSSGGQGDASGAALMSVIDLSWTKGDIVKIQNKDFMVTYKWDLDAAAMGAPGDTTDPTKANEDALRNSQLALSLVAVDSISTLSPATGMTKDAFLKAIEKAAESVKSAPPTAVATAGEPTAPTEETAAGSEQSQTLQRIKDVAIAFTMYTTDWDDVTPYAQSTKAVQYVTKPYCKNDSVWTSLNPAGSQFLYNMSLGGVNASSVEKPAETVLFYEDKPWPDGRRAVAFVDAHSKLVNEDEWAKLEPTLHLKLAKVAKPLPLRYGMDGGTR